MSQRPALKIIAALAALSPWSIGARATVPTAAMTMRYQTIAVDGIHVFYREAGPKSATTLLLLHGFPSSSRMYDKLIPLLADRYHVIAPDYPGFGHSDAPPADQFDYTFDQIARVMGDFAQAIGLQRYVLYMQDYGGPIGFRLALSHPERVRALVIQNANSYEIGMGPLWAARRAFWANRAANEEKLRANVFSYDATRLRHVGTDPDPQLYDPDTWTDERAFLARPGVEDQMLDLFYDYRTNVASFPAWQAYLRKYQPPTLVVWGKYDPSFTVAGALAYKQDVPNAEIHLLDGGHFALDTDAPEIASLIRTFLRGQGIS